MGQPDVRVEFTNKYGEKSVIRKTKNGLQLQRRSSTVVLKLSLVIGKLIGQRIREERENRGWTLADLAHRAGIIGSPLKSRMYEIERGVRSHGIRFGTLYAVAAALSMKPSEMMPTIDEAFEKADITFETPVEQLAVKSDGNGNV